MAARSPILTIQTATLAATTDAATFTGTGGPFAYDPYFGVFDGVVSSQAINGEPFDDQVYGIDASAQLTFVIAIQNFASVAAYNLRIRDYLPLGFVIPPDGPDIVASNGAGDTLAWTGNLFDNNGGLTLSAPLAAFDQTSGANVALITFTLDASVAVPVPNRTLINIAQIVSYAGTNGGPDLSGSSTSSLSDGTTLTTGSLLTAAVANQGTAALASGQTASYDVTLTLPEGTVGDLQITEALPAAGAAMFRLVSAQIVQFGSHLTASGPLAAQADGSIHLGQVVDRPDGIATAADQIVVRVTVANGGTTAGIGTLATTISADDPNVLGNRFTTTLTNTLALAKPDVPPLIAGISARQAVTSSQAVLPFAGLLLADPDVGQTQTLTIHPSNRALGTLSGGTTNAAGDVVLTGPVASVQAAARLLVFTPAAGSVGTQMFGLTLDDGESGVATNATTSVAIAAAARAVDITHYPISTQTVLTSTPTGSTTYAPVETYQGPIDAIQGQFTYDGAAPLAIVAQQNNLLVTSQATATAVQLQGGANTVDVRQGSGFIVSGTGSDVILLHADQASETWNTVVNFHPGDSIALYGFHAGLSTLRWDASAGAAGYTGATLRADVDNDGHLDSSITFTGKSLADTSQFSMQTGTVGGSDYLLISA